MKIPVLFAAAVVGALAQPANQYGVRLGQSQVVFLADPPPVASGSPIGPAPRLAFECWAEGLFREHVESVNSGFTAMERAAGKLIIQRFARDNMRHTYVSYAVTVEALAEAGSYRLTFANSTARRPPLPASENWTVSSPPTLPSPQILRDNETIGLILTADGETGRRQVDYIQPGADKIVPRSGVARDVFADDAAFSISQPALRVNGAPSGQLTAVLESKMIRVSVPSFGRYTLSFRPRPGFVRAGEVLGNTITFSAGANLFRIDCSERIPSGSGSYIVYVSGENAGVTTPSTFEVAAAPNLL